MQLRTYAVTGLLLAAGQGRRYGMPKALASSPGQNHPWVVGAAQALLDGGCREVLAVTGAAAEEVEVELAGRWPDTGSAPVSWTQCGTWESGMGESLRSGLSALAARGRRMPRAVLVHLVDLPDVGPEVITRVLEAGGVRSSALARAAYHKVPGHPVLIGQDHWMQVLASARGDHGARAYLRRHPAELVECGDLATGVDIDER